MSLSRKERYRDLLNFKLLKCREDLIEVEQIFEKAKGDANFRIRSVKLKKVIEESIKRYEEKLAKL